MSNVAQIIFEQLGQGARFMLGARDFVASESSLGFRIGRNAKAINYIRITLDPSDTYTVEFLRVSRKGSRLASSASDVYADSLHSVIENHTGMVTTFPRIRRAS